MKDLKALSSSEVDDIENLSARIKRMQESWRELRMESGGADTPIDLASIGGSFVPVRGRIGIFLVSVKNVEPYLDGYRLNFEIGNPLSATFSNLRIKTVWGPKFDDSKATNDVNCIETYNASPRRKEFSPTDTPSRRLE